MIYVYYIVSQSGQNFVENKLLDYLYIRKIYHLCLFFISNFYQFLLSLEWILSYKHAFEYYFLKRKKIKNFIFKSEYILSNITV